MSLLRGQSDVSSQIPMPTDRIDDSTISVNIVSETVVWNYLSSTVWAAAAGQAAGTIVNAKLVYTNVLNSLKSAQGNSNDTSLSLGAATRFDTRVNCPESVLSELQFLAPADQVAKISPFLSAQGSLIIDHRRGVLWGKPKAVVANDTASYSYMTPIVSNGNVPSGSTDSGNPVKVGGVYNSTLPTLTTGQRGDMQLTSNGSVLVRSDAYDTASQSDRGNEVAPLNQQFINETHINTTNVAAATNYYPSTAGVAMDGYKTISIQGVTSGGVTTTIEATNDDAASPVWLDITLAFNNLMTGATSAATQVDTSFFLSPTLANVLNVKAVRIKSVTSDATNGVQYCIRRVAL